MTPLQRNAYEVAELLARNGVQLVLAESCTAGLVAAALGGIPGISRHLAGSAVVYQERTKAAWLGVPESLFESPGVVSSEVAAAMAAGALQRTGHADLAAAVTGHLGPGAPADLDGTVFIAVQCRGGEVTVTRHQLNPSVATDKVEARQDRQSEAATLVLSRIQSALITEH